MREINEMRAENEVKQEHRGLANFLTEQEFQERLRKNPLDLVLARANRVVEQIHESN